MATKDKVTSMGKCQLCKKKYKKAGMSRHLQKCIQTSKEDLPDKTGEKVYFIVIESKDLPLWWLHLALNDDTTLEELDDFLRDIWLECCGHLSTFEINSSYYQRDKAGEFFGNSVYDSDEDSKSMAIEIGEILKNGTKFSYVYDWGTSTVLKLRVYAVRREFTYYGLYLLARNEQPAFSCLYCSENKVEIICSDCMARMSENALFCNNCMSKHDCEEDYYLPYVNSPRTGLCAYRIE